MGLGGLGPKGVKRFAVLARFQPPLLPLEWVATKLEAFASWVFLVQLNQRLA